MKKLILALALAGAATTPLMAQQPDQQEMKKDIGSLATGLCSCYQAGQDKAEQAECIEKLRPTIDQIDNKYREWNAEPALRQQMLDEMIAGLESCELEDREMLDNLITTLRNSRNIEPANSGKAD